MKLTIEMFMSPAPYTIGIDLPLARAREMMQMHHVRHLPVLEGGRLVGIVSDRDLAFIENLKDVDPKEVSVEEAMSSAVYTVTPDTPLREIATAMASHKYGSAVVMRDGQVAGIFTTIDACATLLRLLNERDGEGLG